MAVDPRPQGCVSRIVGGTLHAAPCRPDVDQGLTVWNATPTSTAVDPRDITRGVFDQMTRTYEVDPTDHTPSNVGVTHPHAPTPWQPGRDPYKIGGMVGQPFF